MADEGEKLNPKQIAQLYTRYLSEQEEESEGISIDQLRESSIGMEMGEKFDELIAAGAHIIETPFADYAKAQDRATARALAWFRFSLDKVSRKFQWQTTKNGTNLQFRRQDLRYIESFKRTTYARGFDVTMQRSWQEVPYQCKIRFYSGKVIPYANRLRWFPISGDRTYAKVSRLSAMEKGTQQEWEYFSLDDFIEQEHGVRDGIFVHELLRIDDLVLKEVKRRSGELREDEKGRTLVLEDT